MFPKLSGSEGFGLPGVVFDTRFDVISLVSWSEILGSVFDDGGDPSTNFAEVDVIVHAISLNQ